jgi:ATP phosphoribosyltransferase regulatory subunit HisZ
MPSGTAATALVRGNEGDAAAGNKLDRDRRSGAMKHDAIELLARMAHIHATGEAGERVPWALLAAEQRDARTHEAVSMLSGLGRTSYPTNPEGLTAPADIAAAAEALIDAWERGEAATGETVARGMPLVMALMRSGSEGTP